ncbi:MAG: DUF3656 domain-containing protein, partial [Parabacteroides sp.]
ENRVFPLEMPRISPKTILYRNYDHAFEKLLEKPSAERKIDVSIEFSDNAFGFTLSATDETGCRAMVTYAFDKELARKPQEDNIRTQLQKLGGTIFKAADIKVNTTGNWFVPSSIIAEMRREVIEKLLQVRVISYKRELVKHSNNQINFSYPVKELTYLGNVYNSKAQTFYETHGVERIAPAFEAKPLKEVPLMFTKHCIRYSMGWCPVHQKQKSPWKEPFYLVYKDTRLKLEFDCKHCQMLVFHDNK